MICRLSGSAGSAPELSYLGRLRLRHELVGGLQHLMGKHGAQVLDVVAEKYPQAYFAGMVSLARREMVL